MKVINETSTLRKVIIGTCIEMGAVRTIDPISKYYVSQNAAPSEKELIEELDELVNVLIRNNIEVVRPICLAGVEQIFVRDIGFVIDDYFFISKMKEKGRSQELEGIRDIIETFNAEKVISFPKDIEIEGGDVVLYNNYVFVGVGNRTSYKAVHFLQKIFRNKTIVPIQIVKSKDHKKNALHLDCVFQPLAAEVLLLEEGGIVNIPSVIYTIFKEKNIIKFEKTDKLICNILSISPEQVIIDKRFKALDIELQKRGIDVIKLKFENIAKLGGLFRCASLPLYRD